MLRLLTTPEEAPVATTVLTWRDMLGVKLASMMFFHERTTPASLRRSGTISTLAARLSCLSKNTHPAFYERIDAYRIGPTPGLLLMTRQRPGLPHQQVAVSIDTSCGQAVQ